MNDCKDEIVEVGIQLVGVAMCNILTLLLVEVDFVFARCFCCD